MRCKACNTQMSDIEYGWIEKEGKQVLEDLCKKCRGASFSTYDPDWREFDWGMWLGIEVDKDDSDS